MNNRMRPINGLTKAKRLLWGSPPNDISWAYIKMLREHNKTCKVFEVNPYIEVYQFRENLFGLYHPNCDGGGDVWLYLIVGSAKAMLIDTGYGLGDLAGLVGQLSGGKPIVVVNTHTGPDHVLGNFRFDKIYCHEYEVQNIHDKCTSDCFDYLFDKNGDNIWLQFDREDLPAYREFELIGVPDGHVWDLGDGHEVELVWTAGHQPGHAMFLDKKSRTLFTGDDVCSDVIGCGSPRDFKHYKEYMNVQSYRDCLLSLMRSDDSP